MLRGSARMSIGGATHAIRAGDVAFLGADVPHNLVNTGAEPAEYFAIQGQP